jgi:hypothetical protein
MRGFIVIIPHMHTMYFEQDHPVRFPPPPHPHPTPLSSVFGGFIMVSPYYFGLLCYILEQKIFFPLNSRIKKNPNLTVKVIL